ncbi:galactokinase [Tetragenococcus solitarius]|uniref:Galactokinase n=1 Tax=Tetragenococcus solitarius TaxID=71453 RepID=A0ABP6KX97_9ENTE|nr:galactokinase [Tetragenococcus solitarius]
MEDEIKRIFAKIFAESAQNVYFAPGRINLIGEHTDYNGGNVFPAAITLGTYAAVRKRDDRRFRLYSKNFPEKGIIEFSLEDLTYSEEDDWANYPKGMLYFLRDEGFSIDKGMDIAFYGNIPNGAGLSSSASIELLTGVVIRDLFDLPINTLDLVKLGQKTENQFIGVNSGIMDQYAVGMGEKDHALLLDTNTLDYEVVPADFGEYVLAIMNTNKQRKLTDSKYNERRSECEQALQKLQEKFSIHALGELDSATFFANTDLLRSDVLTKRAKHVITENERTKVAKEVLEKGDLVEFGRLLNDSHTSLRNDYEVTGKELDTLVLAAQQHPAVLGARMTGAGFGGCALALVKKTEWADFVEDISQIYLDKMGYSTDIYQASIDDGARKL